MPAKKHRNAHGDCKIRLAGTRWTDTKGEFTFEQRLNIGFLSIGARFDQLLAGLDLNRATFEHLKLVARFRRGIRAWPHPQLTIDIGQFDRFSGFKPRIQRLQHLRCPLLNGLFAHDGQLIASADDLD